jgi:hypothetical protein
MEEEEKKKLIMQFLQSPFTSSLVGPYIFLSILFFNTLELILFP